MICTADHAYCTYLMLQRQLSHLNGRKLDHRQVKPLIFSMSGSESGSGLELIYDWRFTANQFILATSPLRFTTSISFSTEQPYVTSSLTTGWVYRSQVLLGSPAQSFSGPSLAELMTIFYCLRLETSPFWRARSPYLYSPGTGWLGYTPEHWVPFSSPPTTRRAKVELFEPATRFSWSSLCKPRHGPYRKHSVIYCLSVSVAVETCLPRRCLAMTQCIHSTIPVYSRHAII
jgi:hypothetical protein